MMHRWMHNRASGRDAGHGLFVVSSVHAHFQGLKMVSMSLPLDLIRLMEARKDGPPSPSQGLVFQ